MTVEAPTLVPLRKRGEVLGGLEVELPSEGDLHVELSLAIRLSKFNRWFDSVLRENLGSTISLEASREGRPRWKGEQLRGEERAQRSMQLSLLEVRQSEWRRVGGRGRSRKKMILPEQGLGPGRECLPKIPMHQPQSESRRRQ